MNTKTMKTHKIRGVEKSVCTAEQMIAYNIAFANIYVNGLDAAAAMSLYRNSAGYSGRYNDEAIEAALFAGADAYRAKPFIAYRYDQIGEAFPLPEGVTV